MVNKRLISRRRLNERAKQEQEHLKYHEEHWHRHGEEQEHWDKVEDHHRGKREDVPGMKFRSAQQPSHHILLGNLARAARLSHQEARSLHNDAASWPEIAKQAKRATKVAKAASNIYYKTVNAMKNI